MNTCPSPSGYYPAPAWWPFGLIPRKETLSTPHLMRRSSRRLRKVSTHSTSVEMFLGSSTGAAAGNAAMPRLSSPDLLAESRELRPQLAGRANTRQVSEGGVG